MMVEIVAHQKIMELGFVLHQTTIQFATMMEETVARETLKPLVMGIVKMKITMQGVALMVEIVAWQT